MFSTYIVLYHKHYNTLHMSIKGVRNKIYGLFPRVVLGYNIRMGYLCVNGLNLCLDLNDMKGNSLKCGLEDRTRCEK